VNTTVFVVPLDVVTEMFRFPTVALLVIVRVALIVVEFTTVKLTGARLTPPVSPNSPVALVRLVPVRVTGTLMLPLAGCVAEFGEIEVSIGAGRPTVNVTVPLVPPGVVTLTVLAVAAAVDGIANVAVTVVAFTTVMPLTVMSPPDTVTAVAPVKLVPVRVTGTLVPLTPVVGAIEVSVG